MTSLLFVRPGGHSFGISFYLFDYQPEHRDECGSGRQFGVMADEVETVMPEVVVHPDGYKVLCPGISLTIH